MLVSFNGVRVKYQMADVSNDIKNISSSESSSHSQREQNTLRRFSFFCHYFTHRLPTLNECALHFSNTPFCLIYIEIFTNFISILYEIIFTALFFCFIHRFMVEYTSQKRYSSRTFVYSLAIWKSQFLVKLPFSILNLPVFFISTFCCVILKIAEGGFLHSL